QADDVEGADEVDLDDLGVSGEVVWSLLADGLLRDADAGAVDDAGQRALRVRLLDECGDARFVRHVRLDEGGAFRCLALDVRDEHLCALLDEGGGGGGAQAGCSARDDEGLVLELHASVLDPGWRRRVWVSSHFYRSLNGRST